MLQKVELQQLQQMSLDDIKAYKEKAVIKKAELEALKAKGGKAWANERQEELDELALFIVDIDEVIEVKANDTETVPAGTTKYSPKKGTEKMVHLKLVRGRRFNPNTGKEESKEHTQLFTFAEWQVFKKHFKGLGYIITGVLHDPYNEAEKLVTKL